MARWRSVEYIAWVAGLPCASCGIEGSTEPHHIKGVGRYSGGSLKAPDHLVMPLCTTCHRALHDGRLSRRHQWEWLARTQALFFHRMAVALGADTMKKLIRGIDAGDVIGGRQ